MGPSTRPPDARKRDLLRDDSACCRAFRAGERWAMARVYETYVHVAETVVVHGFGGFRGFRNPVDRDDAIQAIFAAAFEERARLRYDGIHPYAAFLWGIARNVVRKMLDGRRRFERPIPEVEGSVATVEDLCLEADTARVLRAFRDGLEDPAEREVLQLYFCEGLAEEKLAARLGITRYRTRKIIAQLQRRMKRYLRNHGITGT